MKAFYKACISGKKEEYLYVVSKWMQWNLYVWWKYQVMLLLQQGGACSLNTWQSSVIMSCNELQFWQALISGHQMSLCSQYMLTVEAQARRGLFLMKNEYICLMLIHSIISNSDDIKLVHCPLNSFIFSFQSCWHSK